MAISFERALGIHEQAMNLRSRRSEVLASNLVNADTPNYKARDIDFRSALQGQLAMQKGSVGMRSTNSRHMGMGEGTQQPQLMYRTPYQPSVDGNTVEEQEELARFAKNAMDFQASTQFLSGKFKGLQSAIRGGS
jgi:flagellar basal-body rod protein FlgB